MQTQDENCDMSVVLYLLRNLLFLTKLYMSKLLLCYNAEKVTVYVFWWPMKRQLSNLEQNFYHHVALWENHECSVVTIICFINVCVCVPICRRALEVCGTL